MSVNVFPANPSAVQPAGTNGLVRSDYSSFGGAVYSSSIPAGDYIINTQGGNSAAAFVIGAASNGKTALVNNSGSASIKFTTTESSFEISQYANWTDVRNPFFGATGAAGFAYGNNTYVMVGSSAGTNARISSSTDAVTWTTRNSNFGNNNILSVDFGNGLFVAAGENGRVSTSTDGITWTSRNANAGTSTLNKVAYLNNLWLLGGSGNASRTSTDGITWTSRITHVQEPFAFAYGAGVYVAGGFSSGSPAITLATSTDGTTWTTRSYGSTSTVRGLAFGNGIFVLCGNSGLLNTSTNGISWTLRTSPFGAANTGTDVIFKNGVFIMAGNVRNLATSVDGVSWTTRPHPFAGEAVDKISYGNGLFVLTRTGIETTVVTSATDSVFSIYRAASTGNLN